MPVLLNDPDEGAIRVPQHRDPAGVVREIGRTEEDAAARAVDLFRGRAGGLCLDVARPGGVSLVRLNRSDAGDHLVALYEEPVAAGLLGISWSRLRLEVQ